MGSNIGAYSYLLICFLLICLKCLGLSTHEQSKQHNRNNTIELIRDNKRSLEGRFLFNQFFLLNLLNFISLSFLSLSQENFLDLIASSSQLNSLFLFQFFFCHLWPLPSRFLFRIFLTFSSSTISFCPPSIIAFLCSINIINFKSDGYAVLLVNPDSFSPHNLSLALITQIFSPYLDRRVLFNNNNIIIKWSF